MSVKPTPERLHWMRRIPLFTDLSDREVEQLLGHVEQIDLEPGAVLFREGDTRQRMFLILEGQVQLTRADAYGESRTVMSHGPGDLMGEGMLIDESVHSTTATAVERSEILFLSRDGVGTLLQDNLDLRNRIVTRLLDQVVGRLDQVLFRTSASIHGFTTGKVRQEHDLLGEDEVPAEAYFGLQTKRALGNFDIGGVRLQAYPNLVRALGMVKKATALANRDCSALEPEVADAIVRAADEVIKGKLHEHFVVDVLQGGAGTSTNMNANEVIANRALELLGHEKGEYQTVHPNNHVNCSQSTNDVYPSALKLGMILSSGRLLESVEALVQSLQAKAAEFADVVKMGRTQLQDAVPMTLGQEFEAFAASLTQELQGLRRNQQTLNALNLGGTAIGTGLNTPQGYRERVLHHLRDISGLDLSLAPNLIEATQDTQPFVAFSSSLKSLAIKLSKICNDLRLLSSGPRAGLGELLLPPRQPGSSIMPGKVNPVIPEVVNQVAYCVIGNDLTVTMAAEAGQLQLNVMEPVIGACIFESLKILSNAVITLRINCIDGIQADGQRCRDYVTNSIGLVTALVPALGYEVASSVASEALTSGRSIPAVLRDRQLLDGPQIERLISPERMARPES